MTLLLLWNVSTLCKVTLLASLMDRRFWAEEGCLIKQQKTIQLHNLSKKKENLCTIWGELTKLSPSTFCFFCLSLELDLLSQPWQDRTVPLTGVSKDKENTHSGVTCTHIHTRRHAAVVRPPYRPAVCWGADEGIAKGKIILCMCLRACVRACACVRLQFFLRDSHYVVFHFGNTLFPPSTCHFRESVMTAFSFFFFFFSSFSPGNTRPRLPLSGCIKFAHVWVHGHATACSHRLSNFFFCRSAPLGWPKLTLRWKHDAYFQIHAA